MSGHDEHTNANRAEDWEAPDRFGAESSPSEPVGRAAGAADKRERVTRVVSVTADIVLWSLLVLLLIRTGILVATDATLETVPWLDILTAIVVTVLIPLQAARAHLKGERVRVMMAVVFAAIWLFFLLSLAL